MRLIDATIDGKPALDPGASADRLWSLRYGALPAEGMELTLVAQANRPIHFKLVDQSYSLPDVPSFSYTPRPAGIIAAPSVGYMPNAT